MINKLGLIFLLRRLAKGYKKLNKGTLVSPLFGQVSPLSGGKPYARVGEDTEVASRCCVCVCVKTFSEICKYKALKDARELELFCIAVLLVIFVCLIISLIVQTPIPLT